MVLVVAFRFEVGEYIQGLFSKVIFFNSSSSRIIKDVLEESKNVKFNATFEREHFFVHVTLVMYGSSKREQFNNFVTN